MSATCLPGARPTCDVSPCVIISHPRDALSAATSLPGPTSEVVSWSQARPTLLHLRPSPVVGVSRQSRQVANRHSPSISFPHPPSSKLAAHSLNPPLVPCASHACCFRSSAASMLIALLRPASILVAGLGRNTVPCLAASMWRWRKATTIACCSLHSRRCSAFALSRVSSCYSIRYTRTCASRTRACSM